MLGIGRNGRIGHCMYWILDIGHIRPWTYGTSEIMDIGHIGYWTYWVLDILDIGHNGFWTYWTLDILDLWHIRHWTYWTLDILDIGPIRHSTYCILDILAIENIGHWKYWTLDMLDIGPRLCPIAALPSATGKNEHEQNTTKMEHSLIVVFPIYSQHMQCGRKKHDKLWFPRCQASCLPTYRGAAATRSP